MSTTITSNEVVHAYTYAWLGTPGKSVSTLTRDGVELRRNLATNPGTEVDASGWSAVTPTTMAYAWTGAANASTSTERQNGTLQRTNEVLNPGFNVDITNWSVGANLTAAWNAGRMLNTATAALGVGSTIASSANMPATAGTTKSAAARVVNLTGQQVAYRVAIIAYDSSGAAIGSQAGAPIAVNAGVAVTVTSTGYVLPTGTASYRLYIHVMTAVVSGSQHAVDWALANTGGGVGTYFDGDTAGFTDGVEAIRSTAAAHTGASSLRVRWLSSNTLSFSYVTFRVDGLQADTDYMVSFWLAIPTTLRNPLRVRVADQSDLASTTVQAATSGWVRVVLPVHTAVGRSGFTIWLDTGTGYLSQLIYIDDLLVETGGAELPFFDGSTDSYAEVETTRPVLVLGWEESATGGNVVNDVVGGGVDVTLRPSSLRQGSFELLYEHEDDAAFAFAMHQKPTTLTITDTDRSSVAMRYVVAPGGQITRRLDEQTRDLWAVRVPFQEVTG